MEQAEHLSLTTILCDLDGTLVDSRLDISVAFQQAWRSVIGTIPPNAAAISQHIGKPLTDMVGELGGPLTPSLASAFQTAYRHAYAQQNSRLTRVYPGVFETLQALSTFALGIVTTKEPAAARMVLQQLGLTPFFQHIQGGTADLPLKPAPDTVLAALAALHCTPRQALIVGDTSADIVAGQAAGVLTCAVTYGYGGRDALQQCRPDYVIDTFHELLRLIQASKVCGCHSTP